MDCCSEKENKKKMSVREKSVLFGILASLGLIGFYLGIISIFQGFSFGLMNLRSLWYLIFPLSAGFGTQIGLYSAIKHTAAIKGAVAGTGGFSAGSMIACCSHFLLNMIPIAGISGLAVFLVKYQPAFLGAGIMANLLGIGIMIKHKNKMNKTYLKGGNCHNER